MIALINRLKKEKGNILIFTHENPDADGIGSMLALYEFLKKEGKKVECGIKDPVPQVLDFLPDVDKIQKLPNKEEYDLAILVDAAGSFRAGCEIKAKEIIRIDHHIGGNKESNYDFIDTYAPSTTFLVAKILRYWDEEKIDENIATNLYTGLITDTGNFRYNNVTEEAFELAEFLVKKGVDPHYVSNMVYERNKPSTIRLLQLTLSTLRLYNDNKIAVLIVPRKFLKQTGALEEETEGFVNYARSIEGVEVAFIMIQKEDLQTWRVSIRGKGNVDVRAIAEKFGGGGHRDAAGCRIKGLQDEVLYKLLEASQEQISKDLVIHV